ncbi:MAG TPA: DUF4339 domain-containing protein [Polyangiaceae bacterium]|nr:DUF4339 domain-containing protein [Polyangiaceae bacterium]
MTSAMETTSPNWVTDRWYVTNGVVALGPVAFALLTRGIASGKIPTNSYIRHESWKVWRRLEDIGQLSDSSRDVIARQLAQISADVEARANSEASEPPPPPSSSELARRSDSDSEPPRRSTFRPAAVDPVGVLASAADFDDALLLTLSTAVTASASEVGLLHRVRSYPGLTVTAFAHGPNTEHLLGERLTVDDPSLSAAQAGNTIMGEPLLGEAGRYIAGRVCRCLPEVCAVAMVPLRILGELVGMIEIGRRWRPFRARELARVEDIADALAERAVVMGWPP